jgi:hypothetical protein
MTFEATRIAPPIGTRAEADKVGLLEQRGVPTFPLIEPYPIDSGRVMHRVTRQGEEAIA